MLIISALFLQYLACFAWYQAHAQRSTFASVRRSPAGQWLLRIGGWLISIMAFKLLASSWGTERAVPMWLACVFISGVAAIFIEQWKPRQFHASTAIALVLAVVFLVFNPSTGGSL